jgi:uroporphyrinogen decarboxylase
MQEKASLMPSQTMTGRERILTALRRGTPDCVPSFEWFIDAGVARELTGQTDPVRTAELLDLDAVNVRADYSRRKVDNGTFVDEWGITRKETGDCIPCVVESAIREVSAHKDYRFPDPKDPARFRTLERALAMADGKRAVILNLRDGFSDMRDLLGYENALMACVLDPEGFAALLDRVVDYNLELARIAVERYGVDIVATTDDVANARGLLLSPEMYEQLIAPAFRKVMQGYRDLGYLIIKHCDGNVLPLVDFWIDCGIHCLDPIDPSAGLDIGTIRKQYGDRISLKGNIDCTLVLEQGTPGEVEAAVRDCLERSGRSGLILSSSNSIHRGVKPENYRIMLDTLRREGRTS